MTFTGKIRIYLLLVALITPFLMTLIIYFYSLKQLEQAERRSARQNYDIYQEYHTMYLESLKRQSNDLLQSPQIQKALLQIKSGRTENFDLSGLQTDFDFVELVGSSGLVLASYSRPGLIGETIAKKYSSEDSALTFENEQFDGRGRHAALGCLYPVSDNLRLFSGKYITGEYLRMVGSIISADLILHFSDESDTLGINYLPLKRGALYYNDDRLYTLLAGGGNSNFSLIAFFNSTPQRPLFESLLKMIYIVGGIGILLALLLGWYITGRARREINNLIDAADDIADGDLTTPVMALEEGEFTQLADSLSQMKSSLIKARGDLATAEKIAAWKVMGQKIAHEVKNPLTPISISVDDLRRSYHEKLPGFDKTLDETTSVIKTELYRLTQLIEQFSAFAAMPAPKIENVTPQSILDDLQNLHVAYLENNRLLIINNSKRKYFKTDLDKFKQLLINLIKNGLESKPDSKVEISFHDFDDGIEISLTDNGPGFPDTILKSGIQPYFSTKEKGSGLGLTICQRIVFDFGGNMELYNLETGGAAVKIKLPF